ncbi:Domain of unknown function / Efflux ABC transporter, permease protein [hydrothermal vent metagenome]|uniref:ABC transmembrane type-2 domain-containing protein n=1 Tax=hydrothermal vent metagenome TaxID=652676 RepID=A0A3B0ZQL5_9ZZZZ
MAKQNQLISKALRASIRRFLAVTKARNIEFMRDKSALGWNLFMPVLLVAGFAFIFSDQGSTQYKVAVIQPSATSNTELQSRHPFFKTKYIHFYTVENLKLELVKLSHHRLDMIISPGKPVQYWINNNSRAGYMLEQVLRASVTNITQSGEGSSTSSLKREEVSGEQVRYIDWVLPGILGMNMMLSCMFGIGFVIVRYRKMGVLKRFKATPLSALEFITAQVTSRLMIIMTITSLVFIGSSFFIGLQVKGSLLLLLLVFTLGALSMISMALIVAARASSEELANGLLNLLTWPMLIFSGVWFSLEGLHPAAQLFSQILPLTHMLEAARAIIVDGKGLLDVAHHLIVLLTMSLVFIAGGSMMFRWER